MKIWLPIPSAVILATVAAVFLANPIFAADSPPSLQCTFLPDSQAQAGKNLSSFKITFRQSGFGTTSVFDRFGVKEAKSFMQNNVLYVLEAGENHMGVVTMIYLEPEQDVLAIRSMIGMIDVPGTSRAPFMVSNKGSCLTRSE
jgi:hypothetical protein